MTKLYTKRRIVDITRFEDHIDIEYARRMAEVQNLNDLKDILTDYEEFLPAGLQKFQKMNQEEFQELAKQTRRFFAMAMKGMAPAEPTEAIMLCQPPMLAIPRMLAKNMSHERKKLIPWGTAFLELRDSGHLQKLIQQQERIYHNVIQIKADVEENLDTTSIPPECEISSMEAPVNPKIS